MSESPAGPDRKSSPLDPPASVSGLKRLDRAKFEKTIQVTCLKAESKKLKSILQPIKRYLLKKVNFHPVVKLGESLGRREPPNHIDDC